MFGYKYNKTIYRLLTRRINTFWFKSIDKFLVGGIKKFWSKNHWEKTRKIHKDLWIISHVFICPKMFWNLQIIYCWHKLKAFLPLLPANFSHYLAPNFFNSLPLPMKLIVILVCKSWFHSFFYRLLACTNPTILHDAMLQTHFFVYIYLLNALFCLNLLC